jgi:hypothetical protein
MTSGSRKEQMGNGRVLLLHIYAGSDPINCPSERSSTYLDGLEPQTRFVDLVEHGTPTGPTHGPTSGRSRLD